MFAPISQAYILRARVYITTLMSCVKNILHQQLSSSKLSTAKLSPNCSSRDEETNNVPFIIWWKICHLIQSTYEHGNRIRTHLLCSSFGISPNTINMFVKLLCCLLCPAFGSFNVLDHQRNIANHSSSHLTRSGIKYYVTGLPISKILFHPFQLFCFLFQLLHWLLKFLIPAIK